MCGIVGYLGKKEAAPVLLEGLKRLEYRGYDSAGLCVFSPNGHLNIVRVVGKISGLEERLKKNPVAGSVALGHSRWATHGRPSQENAHPHTDCTGDLALVHNGIIENYLELREELTKKGHRFKSETDTEVIAHLFEEVSKKNRTSQWDDAALLSVSSQVCRRLRGAYALVVLSKLWGRKMIGMRKDCPLVVGVGAGEWFLASDVPALLPFTKEVIFIEDGETVILKEGSAAALYAPDNRRVRRSSSQIPWDPLMAEKGGHKHFMHKEIHEAPRSFEDTLRARAHEDNRQALLAEAGLSQTAARQIRRVQILACGTAYHSGLLAEYLFEKWAGLPAHAEIASEFRYKNRIVEPGTLVIAVSQSGETADTIAALRLARSYPGVKTLGIINQIGSTLTRETKATLYTRCGPEIGVASTKAFIAQLAVFYLLSLALGRARGRLNAGEFKELSSELLQVPAALHWILSHSESQIQELAREFQGAGSFIYLGRHLFYPIALEGALKLKEISYIHAEGFAAGEMKHGPIALIEPGTPVFAFAPKNSSVYEKLRSNLEEAKARGGKIIAVAHDKDHSLRDWSHRTIALPPMKHDWFEPPLAALVTQLFAYHVASLKGLDVDQPRNLAKSVTVE